MGDNVFGDTSGCYNSDSCRPIPPWFRGVKYPAIPTEYDDALSYYEALQKLHHAVNQAIECLNGRIDGLTSDSNEYTDQEISKLKSYVDEQDDNIDEKYSNLYNDIVQANLELVIKVNQLYDDWSKYQERVDGRVDLIYGWLRDYVNELFTSVKPPIYVIDPVNGQMSTLQDALDDMWRNWNSGGITAGEYDSLMITASKYDMQMITAWVYDNRARQLPFFYDRIYGAMVDPFTGTMNSVVNVVYKLAALHKKALTVEEYDGLRLTAEEYDGKSLTAYEYDWNGKVALGVV